MEFIRFFLKHKVTFLMLLLVSIALARLQAFTLVMIITEVVCLGMCVMCMLAYTSHAFRKQPIVTLLLKKAKKHNPNEQQVLQRAITVFLAISLIVPLWYRFGAMR